MGRVGCLDGETHHVPSPKSPEVHASAPKEKDRAMSEKVAVFIVLCDEIVDEATRWWSCGRETLHLSLIMVNRSSMPFRYDAVRSTIITERSCRMHHCFLRLLLTARANFNAPTEPFDVSVCPLHPSSVQRCNASVTWSNNSLGPL